MIKYQLLMALALFAGVAIGYFAAPTQPAKVFSSTERYIPEEAAADEGENASIAALRARIRELEAELAAGGNESAALISNAVSRLERRERGDNPREMMERMKKEDPERYTQMTNRFAQWQQFRRERQQTKLDFLSSIDTTHMSASERATHERLQNLIVQREEMEAEIPTMGEADEETRREFFGQMMELNREIGELNGSERKILLGETAKILGLGDADANALVETVQDILEVTEGGFGGPGGGGPGGRGGPRGGRGGRGR